MSETFALDRFLLEFFGLDLALVVDVELFPLRDAVIVDAPREGCFGLDVFLELEWERVVSDLGFDLLEDLAAAFAFRRRRRWTLVIASISSSFLIPCHPATP